MTLIVVSISLYGLGPADMAQDPTETIKHATDVLSIATVVGALMNILPAIAALFTIVWTAIRIYETRTVQGWLNKGKQDESAGS
jgi:cell division protein FtsX